MCRISITILLVLALAAPSWQLQSDICNYKQFPVFAGGAKDEFIQCLMHDPTNNFFIAGGKTKSSDFAPAENDHGFVYALNEYGDWMWGNFFYNVSNAVSDVTGCTMSSKNSYLAILGKSNTKPIVMYLNKNDGSINKFITIEPIAVATVAPVYTTHAGLLYEEAEEGTDGKSYLYVSFTKDSDLHMLKIENSNPLAVTWHYMQAAGGLAYKI